MGFIISLILAGMLGLMGLVPLRRAAEYRFRNQTGNILKGAAYFGAAFLGMLSSGFLGWLILIGGVLVGVGLLATGSDEDRKLLR